MYIPLPVSGLKVFNIRFIQIGKKYQQEFVSCRSVVCDSSVLGGKISVVNISNVQEKKSVHLY